MTDVDRFAVSKVSFTTIDIPGGLRAFVLKDRDNGNSLTFIEIGNGTDEWAVKSDHDPVPELMSTVQARRLALESDQNGIPDSKQPGRATRAA